MISLFRILGIPVNVFESQSQLIFVAGLILLILLPYCMGSINSAIIVSHRCYHDDIRKYGSGNAGLTNMNRIYGGKAAILTFAGDVLKQVISVAFGIYAFGQIGAYISGLFCMLGHIAPVFHGFKGGKGVLTAATLILLIDWQIFLVIMVLFLITVLLTGYISLGSLVAAFALPAAVYYSQSLNSTSGKPDAFSMICSLLIGSIIFITHSSNIKRLANGTENKFSLKKHTTLQQVIDKEDPENDIIRDRQEAEEEAREKSEKKKLKEYNKNRRKKR